jgi:hypothetical protein
MLPASSIVIIIGRFKTRQKHHSHYRFPPCVAIVEGLFSFQRVKVMRYLLEGEISGSLKGFSIL